ncbi:hypothetical protein F5Y05DRAFT_381777 [Hypoxylon sp. FL0543]|nr:hypothetical protein F5Y05DRAFT_381777 [Hypoxylon sp. FL0543]
MMSHQLPPTAEEPDLKNGPEASPQLAGTSPSKSDMNANPVATNSSVSVDTVVSPPKPEVSTQSDEEVPEAVKRENAEAGRTDPTNKTHKEASPSFYTFIRARTGAAYHKTFGRWPWTLELVNIILATLAMIALIVLLSQYNDTPLSPWVFGITLNGVIAFLSAIWRLGMMSVVAECMGQLKWKWLDRPRKLLDVQIFDESTRGIPGSLKLIMRRYPTFAQIGAIFMVLSIAFDPFTQLLVDYPTKTIKVRDERVRMSRAVHYALVPPDEASIVQDLHDHRLDHYLIQNVQAAMLLRSQQNFERFYNSHQNCPTRNNCTWDMFPTLGVCSKCVNLTDIMQTDCEQHPAGNVRNCSYSFPGVASFQIESSPSARSAPWFFSKEISNNASDRLLNIGNPIIAVAMLRLPIFDLANASSYNFYPPRNATACGLYHCVQTCTGSTTNAQAVVKIKHEWTNTSMDASGETTDIVMTPSKEDLHIPTHVEYNTTAYYVPARVAKLVREFFRSQLVGNITVTAAQSANNQTITDIHPALDTTIYLVNPLAFATFTYVGGQMYIIYDSISTAVTLYYRTLQENANYSVVGYTNNSVPVVQVRWYWISLPLLMYVLSLILALLTLSFDQPLAPGWKNSSLAILFHGLEKMERFAEVRTLKEMEKEAEGIEVQLRGDAKVLHLAES